MLIIIFFILFVLWVAFRKEKKCFHYRLVCIGILVCSFFFSIEACNPGEQSKGEVISKNNISETIVTDGKHFCLYIENADGSFQVLRTNENDKVVFIEDSSDQVSYVETCKKKSTKISQILYFDIFVEGKFYEIHINDNTKIVTNLVSNES